MSHVYQTLELNPYPSDKLDVLYMYVAAYCFHVCLIYNVANDLF